MQIVPIERARDAALEKLAFLKTKGLTVGKMKTSDKPEPYLLYLIDPDSELDDLPTVHKLINAEIEIKQLHGQISEIEKMIRMFFNTSDVIVLSQDFVNYLNKYKSQAQHNHPSTL